MLEIRYCNRVVSICWHYIDKSHRHSPFVTCFAFVLRKLIRVQIFTLITLRVVIAQRSGRACLGDFPGEILRSFNYEVYHA